MAAERIKGITIEIGGDTSKLTKALASVDYAISKTKTNLRDINNALKFDPSNVNLLKDRQVELANEIKNVEEKLKTEKEALNQLKNTEGFDANSQAARNLKTQIDLDESALKNLKKEAKDASSVMGSAFKAIGGQVQEAGNQISDVGNKIKAIGEEITQKVTVPIATAFGAAIKVTADFDSQMSKVQAISGATGEEFNQLRDKAREMGESTKFSATEAGQAFEYMGMAGWKTEQMMSGIDGILNLAAASGEELGTTADIVTDALTAFGMSADESGRFADILAAAATNANTNVSMMGESFKYVAPVAGSLGYSAEDVAVALGLMANSGIKADMAGTSLRNMFQRMAKPTKESAEAMDRLGLALYDDEGKMYSFREIMNQMRTAFSEINISAEEYDAQLNDLDAQLEAGTLTQKKYDAALEELNLRAFGAEGAEKARAAAMLGGTRALSGLLAIANTAQSDYDALTKAIDNSSDAFARLEDGSVVPLSEALESGATVIETYNGQAEAMAATMQNNLSGEITVLKSQLEELAISFGDLMMPLVREIVEKIQNVVTWLNNLDEAHKKTILKIAAIAAAVGPVLIVIGTVVGVIGKIVTAVGFVIEVIGMVIAALNPVTLAIAAVIAVLTTLGIFIYKNWDAIKEWAQGVWIAIQEMATKVMFEIIALKDGMIEKWNSLKEMFYTIVSYIVIFVFTKFQELKTNITTVTNEIRNTLTQIWNNIKAFLQTTVDNIKTTMTNVWTAIKTFLITTINAIKTNISTVWNNIKSFLSNTVNSIKSNISTAFNNIKNTISEKITGAKNAIIDGMQAACDFIKDLPGKFLDWGRDMIDSLIDGITSRISAVGDAIGSVADTIAGYIHFSEPDLGPLSNFHTFMPDMIKEMVRGINQGIPQLESAMSGMAASLVPSNVSGAAGGNITTVNLTVYGAPGQDVTALADIIQQEINQAVYSQEAVFR